MPSKRGTPRFTVPTKWSVLPTWAKRRRDSAPGLQGAALGQRDPRERSVANDQVVMHAQIEQRGALDELTREPKILPRRCRIAARMVVHENQRGGAFSERWPQDLAGMNQRVRLRADRHLGVQQIPVLSVQQDHPEVFLVVIV